MVANLQLTPGRVLAIALLPLVAAAGFSAGWLTRPARAATGEPIHVGGGSLNHVAVDSVGVNTAGAPMVAGMAPGSGTATSSFYAYPAKGGGPFQPGLPPFGQGALTAGGEGLSAYGVAYRETSDGAAKADTALVQAAYNEAGKEATLLAGAAGLKLGRVLAIGDISQTMSWYQPCFEPGIGVPNQVPPGGTGISSKPIPAPAPAATPCMPKYYVVTWVVARYAIG